jgi:hypothetical protein
VLPVRLQNHFTRCEASAAPTSSAIAANTDMVHQHYGHLLAYHGDINKLTIT